MQVCRKCNSEKENHEFGSENIGLCDKCRVEPEKVEEEKASMESLLWQEPASPVLDELLKEIDEDEKLAKENGTYVDPITRFEANLPKMEAEMAEEEVVQTETVEKKGKKQK